VKIASVAEVKARLSASIKEAEGGPLLVTRNGKLAAVPPGFQDEEEIGRLILGYSARLRAIPELSRQQIRDGQGVGHQEFWAGVEMEGPWGILSKSKGKPG